MKKKEEEIGNIEPETIEQIMALKFTEISAEDSFQPITKSPIPKPLRLRHQSRWWTRCVDNTLIPFSVCSESFVDINALYKKNHPCWNCPLGKVYRRAMSEDNFTDERIDTAAKLQKNK